MGKYKNSGNGVGTRGNPQQSINQNNFSDKNRQNSSLMPNYDKATIDDRKFLNYSLDENNPKGRDKAVAYKLGLGYDKSNYQSLKKQIMDKVNSGNAKMTKTITDQYGTRYTYEIPVVGINGNTKTVIVSYQIDKGKSIPRLVTNYLKKKGKK